MPTVIRLCSVERNGGRKASNRRIITRHTASLRWHGMFTRPPRGAKLSVRWTKGRGDAAVRQDRVAQIRKWSRLSGYGRPGAEPWSALLEGDPPGPRHAYWDDRPGEGRDVVLRHTGAERQGCDGRHRCRRYLHADLRSE